MNGQSAAASVTQRGVTLFGANGAARKRMRVQLEDLGLDELVSINTSDDGRLHIALRDQHAAALAPDADTLAVGDRLPGGTEPAQDSVKREILAAMFASPYPIAFPSDREFASAVRMRENIVHAAARTQLAFDTESIERPEDCWRYSEESGFTILPGYPIIDALIKATQPDQSGRRYAFSCYRATEYVILLGIAQELAAANPALFERLQARWERKAIMSGAFHEAFLVEKGSIDNPVPARYYVPGDRVWFRNPDAVSSDISGYEGSWVIYLGRGLFSNFWKAEAPYTLKHKCLEIFHWRHGVARDEDGRMFMDEVAVEQGVARSLVDPDESQEILGQMMRYRAPQGVYANGGCIDASREYPRFVHPETSDIRLEV